jgi:tRNA (guanine37-N1)-methyltransferase
MRFDIVTLFPEMIRHAAGHGVTGRAIESGIAKMVVWNPRDFTTDRHRTVDDRPYGGGPGMVMKVGPLRDAIRAARNDSPITAKTIYLSPQGALLNQEAIKQFVHWERLILVAGRYEGVDERLIETEINEEWSLGDYVLSGGELAALVVFDAVVRLLPGVLGHADSAAQDSHMAGLLDCPHYTRPEIVDGLSVPDILQGGNHEAIRRWRLKQAMGRTWMRRPDLLAKLALDLEQEELLHEFKEEFYAISKPN